MQVTPATDNMTDHHNATAVLAQPANARHSGQQLAGLLMISYYFPPANFIGASRPFRFAKYLRRMSYPVSVVTADHAPDIPGWECVSRRPGQVKANRTVKIASRVCALTQRLLPYNEQLPWLPHAVAAGSEIIRKHSARVVYSTSPPLVPHLAALVLKWRYGLKWIADFRDPLLGNTCRARRFASAYDSALEQLIFSQADLLTTVTDSIADSWRAKYPKWASKIQVMWNGFDPEEAIAAAAIPARPYKTIVHLGGMYAGRSPHRLLASLERLIQGGRLDPTTLRVRLVGSSDHDAVPLDRAPASTLVALGCLDCQNTAVPRPEAHRIMAEADYLLILEAPDNTTTVPGKLFEYIPVGRPIMALTAENSPVDRILSRSGLEYACLYPGDTESTIDRKVLQFLGSASDPLTPSEWFRNEFDSSQQVLHLAALLNRLVED
jgi:hypothetical protein